MTNILVIGSLNADFSARVDHIPQVGETILADNMIMNAGGKGANQAYTASKLGGNVMMLGAVGSDTNGDMLISNLGNVGVDVSRIKKHDKLATGMAWITVTRVGDNCITVIPGANMAIDRAYIDENMSFIKACDIVLLQLEIPLDTVAYVVKKAKEMSKTVILDPAPASKYLPEDIWQYIDILKPNETELSILTDVSDVMNNLDTAADILLRRGVGKVIVTLGQHGVFLKGKGCPSERFMPATEINAVDTTAAGDSFTAALSVALSYGGELRDAIRFAMKTAEIVVTRYGAQSSIPTADEVMKLITLNEA